jgi:predicted DNA-binding WGR domain protein
MSNEESRRIWMWKSDTRYYIIRLQKDLFDEWALLKEWGGLSNKLGRSKCEAYINLDHAIKQIHYIARRREERGYNRIS